MERLGKERAMMDETWNGVGRSVYADGRSKFEKVKMVPWLILLLPYLYIRA